MCRKGFLFPDLRPELFEDIRLGLDDFRCQRQSKNVKKRRRNFVIFWRGVVIESVTSLPEKSVDDLLFLAHKFLALLQAVRLALDVNDSAVMQDTIQDCGGDRDIGEDLIPLHWEKVLLEVKLVDIFSYRLAMS